MAKTKRKSRKKPPEQKPPAKRSRTDRAIDAMASGAYLLATFMVVGVGTGVALTAAQATADALGFEDRTPKR